MPFYSPSQQPTENPTPNPTNSPTIPIPIPTQIPTVPQPTYTPITPTQVPTSLTCDRTSILFQTRFVLDIDAYYDTAWIFVGIEDNVMVELSNGTIVNKSIEYIIRDDSGENYNVWDGEVAIYETCLTLINKNFDCYYLAIEDSDGDGLGGEIGGEYNFDDSTYTYPSRRTNIDVYLGHELLTKDYWNNGHYWGIEFCVS